LLITQI